ncbi:hypothetical protein ACE6H2_004154 [Prunus campanulata]
MPDQTLPTILLIKHETTQLELGCTKIYIFKHILHCNVVEIIHNFDTKFSVSG